MYNEKVEIEQFRKILGLGNTKEEKIGFLLGMFGFVRVWGLILDFESWIQLLEKIKVWSGRNRERNKKKREREREREKKNREKIRKKKKKERKRERKRERERET